MSDGDWAMRRATRLRRRLAEIAAGDVSAEWKQLQWIADELREVERETREPLEARIEVLKQKAAIAAVTKHAEGCA